MNKVCKISLFPLILACVSSMPADARVTTKNSNRSYAGAYQQINAMRYQQEYETATTASATATLPVMVSDKELEEAIINGTAENVGMSDLEACSMIYPSGVFKWQIPESGVRRNQMPQCVAVVELRNATTNELLATTTVAAGDTFKCNVDSFPQSGMSTNLKYGKVEVPADIAPTMDDVIAVMNEEQKQNAGLKIAAAAIIGGVAGNLLGQKQAGDTKLFGTGQTQLIDTAIGTAAGAGIMAASSYSGKVAGDTIKSTAVNAASGMILGNMLAGAAGSDSVLATTKCKTKDGEQDCIIGSCATKDESKKIEGGKKDDKFYFIKHGCKEMLECSESNIVSGSYINCTQVPVSKYVDIKVTPKDSEGAKLCSSIKASDYQSAENTYKYDPENQTRLVKANDGIEGIFFPITSATEVSKLQHAYAVLDLNLAAKPLGYTEKDWEDTLKDKEITYYYRNSDGTLGNEINTKDCDFQPKTRDADDGALVDISNQARAKGTLVGTAAGGALGGFSGYQGAQDEATQRWVTAVLEYEDSLSNFMCITGTRFLSKYNDYVEIPDLKKLDQ